MTDFVSNCRQESRMKFTDTPKPYPAYKPSGIDWLGDIPAHWDVRRLKDVGQLQGGAGFPHRYQDETSLEIPFFKVADMGVDTNARLMKEWQHTVSMETAKALGAYLFPASTIVFAKVGAALLLNRRRLLIRPACIDNNMMGFIPLTVAPGWMLYWMSTIDLGMIVNPGAVPSVNEGQVGRIATIVPPLAEQAAIARFLDRDDEQISRAISAKERLIELLTEQRQAIIHRAVTRGLAPDVRLKASGVEWLGDVPAHWDVRRLSYLALKFGSGITPRGGATVYQETGIPFLRSQNIQFDGIRLEDVAHISEKLHDELTASRVKPGDVLLNITGASIGRVCSVPMELAEANVNQHVCIIRPRKEYIIPDFLSAYLSTPMIQGEIYTQQSGASREGLTLQSIRGLLIPLPLLSEQIAIARHIDKATADIDAAIANAQRQIDLLREYRTRLIADAVTGRVDVRGAA